jgi:hypothetical protein
MGVRVLVVICVVGAVLLTAVGTWARVGAGVAAGDPSELNLRYWSRGHSGFDLGAGWTFQRGRGGYVHMDYLWSAPVSDTRASAGSFHWYIGAGLWAQLRWQGDGGEGGLRIPVGVDYVSADRHFNLFAEIAPAMSSYSFVLYGGVGVRYLF